MNILSASYYFKIFNKRREEIKKVLEIGIGNGASLRMWQDFFPNAQIFGVDYRQDLLFNENSIQTFQVDQRKANHLENLINTIGVDIDLIVDDGSHRPRDQVFTCSIIMPIVKNDVIYVIENVSQPEIAETLSQYGYQVKSPKIKYAKQSDNTLIVVKHKLDNTKFSFFTNNVFSARGVEIAEYLDAKLNPLINYQKDICIYVKPSRKKGENFTFQGKRVYLDIIDDLGFVNILRKQSNINVISLSVWDTKVLKKLLPNKIITIPEHHCNIERAKRNSSEIKKIGIVGSSKDFINLPKDIKTHLMKRKIEFIEKSNFADRHDLVEFYKGIDLQLIWRPYLNYRKDLLVNPIQIINASSFGVPTIAYDEPVFWEVEGSYIPVHTLEEFLTQIDKLQNDNDLYKRYSNIGLQIAENYHITKIAQLYKKLVHQ